MFLLLLVLMIGCASRQMPQQHKNSEALLSPQTATNAETEVSKKENGALSGFILGPNDVVNVSVYRNDDLKTSVKVGPTGTVMLPLIGEINASGMDINTFQKTIESRLSKYLNNPIVTVNVDTVASMKFMVLGEVGRPGSFAISSQTSLIEALSKAGGNTTDAKLSNVVLIRRENGKTVVTLHDINKALKEGQLEHDTTLQHNDIVYVPAITVANVSRFFSHISKILSPIVNLESGIVLWPDVLDVLEGGTGNADLSISTGN